VTILGVVAYYDHYWNDKWSSSIGWSMTDIEDEDGQALHDFNNEQIASTNLLYCSKKNVMRVSNLPGENVRMSTARTATITEFSSQ
jgi:hypothetical protein